MIPIILITGFLGSGKTTLIKELYSKLANKKVCYLINEFSQLDVDGQTLKMDGQEVITVTGGSIFCQCLVTQFITQLRSIAGNKNKWDALVIEASGISNPTTILRMLQETKLDSNYDLQTIITIIEPGTFLKLIQVLPVIRDQIKAANYIIINKIKSSKPEDIHKSLKEIKSLNSSAQINQTDFCRIDFDPLNISDASRLPVTGPIGHEPQSQFGKYSIKSSRVWNIEKLQTTVERFGADIYRVKGIIKIESSSPEIISGSVMNKKIDNTKLIHIDYSNSGWNIQDHNDPDAICHLDFIFNQEKSDEIRTAIRGMK